MPPVLLPELHWDSLQGRDVPPFAVGLSLILNVVAQLFAAIVEPQARLALEFGLLLQVCLKMNQLLGMSTTVPLPGAFLEICQP